MFADLEQEALFGLELDLDVNDHNGLFENVKEILNDDVCEFLDHCTDWLDGSSSAGMHRGDIPVAKENDHEERNGESFIVE